MRDPMSWSIPLFRAFGIQVRLHILYIILVFALAWRASVQLKETRLIIEYLLIVVVMLFVIILLHEFGHCFAARRVNGSANEILMWPLGGLAFCEVPHTPRANFITAIGGPLVNVIICVVCALVLGLASYAPPLNPFRSSHLFSPELYSFKDGKTHLPEEHARFQRTDGKDKELLINPIVSVKGEYFYVDPDKNEAYAVTLLDLPRFNDGVLWTARLFYLSWILFLFNLIPAFPLDGGRVFQCIIWNRRDYRTGTTYACYSGYVCAVLMIIASLGTKDPMMGFLALFIWFSAQRQLMMLDMESEGFMGYDFSQGYTSLERDNDDDEDESKPAPKPKKVGFIGRWLQARRERRKQREEQERAADQARLDDLLDKVHREGLHSLSDEERKFMNRVSAKYKNKS
jgi:Zn-dependent protease